MAPPSGCVSLQAPHRTCLSSIPHPPILLGRGGVPFLPSPGPQRLPLPALADEDVDLSHAGLQHVLGSGLAVLLLEMPPDGRLVSEAHITVGAAIGPCSRVEVEVVVQCGLLREALAADATRVRLDAAVYVHVPVEVAAVVELLAAARAHEDEVLSPHVEDQLLHALEHFRALGALDVLEGISTGKAAGEGSPAAAAASTRPEVAPTLALPPGINSRPSPSASSERL